MIIFGVKLPDLLLTTHIGNFTTPQILVTCEVPVALASSCLPLIFVLVKHGAQRLPTTYKWNASKCIRGRSAPDLDSVGSAVDDRNKKGFVQLSSDPVDPALSQERLFDNTTRTKAGFAMKFSSRQVRDKLRRDTEMGIPLHQIRVREDGDDGTK